MNRRELVAELAERLEIDKRSADTGLQAFVDIVTDTVVVGRGRRDQRVRQVRPGRARRSHGSQPADG